MFKKVSIIVLSLGIVLTGLVNADVKETTAFDSEGVSCEVSWDNEKAFLEDLNVSEEDYAKLTKLIDEIAALEANEKYEEAEKKWDEYVTILEKYTGKNDVMVLDWNSEAAYLASANVAQSDIDALQVLYNNAVASENDNNVTLAKDKWEAYFNKFDEVVPAVGLTGSAISVDDEKAMFKELKVSADDMKALEKILEEIKVLEEKEDNDAIDQKWIAYERILKKYGFGEASFDMEKAFLKTANADAKDIDALETLFNKAVKLEKEAKYEEADAVWAEYDKIMNKYYDVKADFTMETIEDDYSKLNLEPEAVKALKAAFEKAVKLEKEAKYDAAEEAWNAYYELLDQHMDQ